jgi:hypothetical protein
MYDSAKETKKHKNKVKNYTKLCARNLLYRGIIHDDSKLQSPEKEIFDEYTPKLKDCTYGSEEYKQYLKEMNIALEHHYLNNDHHPEYFSMHYKARDGKGTPAYTGLSGMNLMQLTEMLCDWYAATQRHADGDIYKSIEQNQYRFGYSDEIKSIFYNTIQWIKEREDIIGRKSSEK